MAANKHAVFSSLFPVDLQKKRAKLLFIIASYY